MIGHTRLEAWSNSAHDVARLGRFKPWMACLTVKSSLLKRRTKRTKTSSLVGHGEV